MKNNMKILIIGGFALVTIIVIIFVFFIFPQNTNDFSQSGILNEKEPHVFPDAEKSVLVDSVDKQGEFLPSTHVSGWQQYTNRDYNYVISIPQDFAVQDEMPNHIDISSPDYDGSDKNGLRIQIQKKLHSPGFETVAEYHKFIVQAQDDLIDMRNIGDNVTLSHYTNHGPDGAFITFKAFDEKNDVYYNILVFEPGYANNKELTEQIIKTFTIL